MKTKPSANSAVVTSIMKEEELVRLRELPSLPPTGSDGLPINRPFIIPQRKGGGKRDRT